MTHMLLPITTTQGTQTASHRVLLPHRLFAALWEADPQVFLDHWCGGSQEALETFWEGLKGTKVYVEAARMGLRNTVPLKLFGDGVAVLGMNKSWGKSVDTFLMSSLVSRRSSKCSEVVCLVSSLMCSNCPDKFSGFDVSDFRVKLGWI